MSHPRTLALEKIILDILPNLSKEFQIQNILFLERFKEIGVQYIWNAQDILPICQAWLKYGYIEPIDAICKCRMSTADEVLSFLSGLYQHLQDECAIKLTPLVYKKYKNANTEDRLGVKNQALPYLWEYCLENDPKETKILADRVNMWSTPVLYRAIQTLSEKVLFQKPNLILQALQKPCLHASIQKRWTFTDFREIFTAFRIEWPAAMQYVYSKYATWQILLWKDSYSDTFLNDLLDHMLPGSFDERMLSWICKIRLVRNQQVDTKIKALAQRYPQLHCSAYDLWINSGLTNSHWIDGVGRGEIIPDEEQLWIWGAEAPHELECTELL